MAAGVVRDDGVRHAVLAEFPRRELRSLAARPRFVHPDVDRNSGVVRGVDRRGGRTVIDEGEPAGVAMREDVDRGAAFFLAQAADQLEAVLADAPAIFRIFIRYFVRRLERDALSFLG